MISIIPAEAARWWTTCVARCACSLPSLRC